ncbi:hypothetical protein VTO73DRAFT_11707 [Trametes versicolor]
MAMPDSMTGQKRRRAESDSQTNAGSISFPVRTRDPEFWFEDGSVVLVAHGYGFRVFKGVLAHHSPVFQDMFSLPQPVLSAPSPSSRTASEGVDPCPVVHLSDSPEDLRHVLRLCLPRSDSRFISFAADNLPFDMVSAIIRLGHKYQIQLMVTQGVQYLQRWFTDDLDTWAAAKLYEHDCPIKREHAIGVVNLARLVEEPSLLPTALLMCCSLDEDIVRGYTREDGTQETLTLDDIGRCCVARARLVECMVVLTMQIFKPSVEDSAACTTPQKFKRVLQEMLLDVGENVEYFAGPDIFGSWLGLCEDLEPVKRCASCRNMLKTRDREERLEVWWKLPKYMGVTVRYADPCTRERPIDNLLEKKGSSGVRLCRHCRKMVEERDSLERRAAWKKLPEIFDITLPPAPGGAAR